MERDDDNNNNKATDQFHLYGELPLDMRVQVVLHLPLKELLTLLFDPAFEELWPGARETVRKRCIEALQDRQKILAQDLGQVTGTGGKRYPLKVEMKQNEMQRLLDLLNQPHLTLAGVKEHARTILDRYLR